jgi:hypothetical protein
MNTEVLISVQADSPWENKIFVHFIGNKKGKENISTKNISLSVPLLFLFFLIQTFCIGKDW